MSHYNSAAAAACSHSSVPGTLQTGSRVHGDASGGTADFANRASGPESVEGITTGDDPVCEGTHGSLRAEPPPLKPEHVEQLRESGIPCDLAIELGVHSAEEAEVKRLLDFKGDVSAGLAIPYFDVTDGKPLTISKTPLGGGGSEADAPPYVRIRLDDPGRAPDRNGKPAKYRSRRGSGQYPYVIPRVREFLSEPGLLRIIMTEGEKKALCAFAMGLAVIGLQGNWGWKKKDLFRLLDALSELIRPGMEVVVVWDSDAATNPDFGASTAALHAILRKMDCTLRVVVLPPDLKGGLKVGLDDYLVANGVPAFEGLVSQSPLLPKDRPAKADALLLQWTGEFARSLASQKEAAATAGATAGAADAYDLRPLLKAHLSKLVDSVTDPVRQSALEALGHSLGHDVVRACFREVVGDYLRKRYPNDHETESRRPLDGPADDGSEESGDGAGVGPGDGTGDGPGHGSGGESLEVNDVEQSDAGEETTAVDEEALGQRWGDLADRDDVEVGAMVEIDLGGIDLGEGECETAEVVRVDQDGVVWVGKRGSRGKSWPVPPNRLRVTKPAQGKQTKSLPDLATEFLRDSFRHGDQITLRSFRDSFWAWQHGSYHKLPDGDVEAKLMGFLRQQYRPAATVKGLRDLWVNLKSDGLCHVPSDLIPPVWLAPGGEIRPAADLLALRNGILDVAALVDGHEDGQVWRPPDPSLFVLSSVPVGLDQDAQCPRFEAFLREVQPDGQVRRLLQEMVGLFLLPDTSYQRFFILYGDGCNGKSVFTDVVCSLLGGRNCCSVPLSRFGERFSLYPLTHCLLNCVSELPTVTGGSGQMKTAEDTLKRVVSGDLIDVEQKGKDLVTARPTARLLFTTNELPAFADRSDGTWRRCVVLPFGVKIEEHRKDTSLARKIVAEELPGVGCGGGTFGVPEHESVGHSPNVL